MTPFLLAFFLTTLLTNIILFWLSFLLFRKTQGALQGWRYMSFYGLSLAFMSLAGLLRVLTQGTGLYTPFLLLISLFSFVAGILITLGSTSLLADLGMQPKTLSARNVLIAAGLVVVALIAVALPRLDTLLGERVYAIALHFFAFVHLVASYHFLTLSRVAKRRPWYGMAGGTLIAGVGMFAIVYTGMCCASDGPLAGTCALTPPFGSLYPQYCAPAMSAVSLVAYLSIIVATLFIVVSYFLICREFFGMFKKAETPKAGEK